MEFSHTLPSSTAFRLISKSKPGQIKKAMVSGLQDGKLTLSSSHATQTAREARVSGCQDGKVKRLTLPEPRHIKHSKTKAPPVGGAFVLGEPMIQGSAAVLADARPALGLFPQSSTVRSLFYIECSRMDR